MESTEIALTRTAARVLCPLCGLSMESNAANRCSNCMKNEVDLQAEVPTSYSTHPPHATHPPTHPPIPLFERSFRRAP